MNSQQYCFCGLAFGKKYRDCAISLAADFETFHPGVNYLVLTDKKSDFQGITNIIAIQRQQDSVLYPFHDRRFALKEALARYNTTIQIDTDVKLLKPLFFPPDLTTFPGIIGITDNLHIHLNKYQPQNLIHYQKIAEKLEIPFDDVPHLGEFVFATSRDQGKEEEFIYYWGMIARYLELQGIHLADGPAIGLAATKVGLSIQHSDWPKNIEANFVEHFKFSSKPNQIKPKKSTLEKIQFRLKYNYRLNRTRLKALKDFRFYYS